MFDLKPVLHLLPPAFQIDCRNFDSCFKLYVLRNIKFLIHLIYFYKICPWFKA